MVTLKSYEPESEKELHDIIEQEIDALEGGLRVLKHEISLEGGIPDFLCADSGERLTIIEVKLQEDENILFQALRYYSEIDKKRFEIAKHYPTEKIKPNEHPRVILIAKHFSEDVKRLSTLVRPDVELYEYTTVKDSTSKIGIIFHNVSLPTIDETLSEPVSIKNHRDYITKEELKPIFDRIREEITNVGKESNEYSVNQYIGYKFKGRQFAWIAVQRKSFDVGSHIIDEKGQILDYKSIRINSPEDIKSESYREVLERIKKSFQNLGGKPKTDM